jgi:parallel beta-helix repeat protein
MLRQITILASAALMLGACDSADPDFPNVDCGDFTYATCVRVPSGDAQALFDAVNALGDDTVVILGIGTYSLDNQVTIRGANQIAIVGQGMDDTILDFGVATAQINGIDAIADDFLVQDLTVLDVPKDGIRVEDSDGVTYRRIKATWSTPGESTNGAYGIYPVRCQNVLVEDSVAEHSSDAGLYVGQCRNVIVRNNLVSNNVAGLEIENTQYADVYNNTAEDNTGGLVVFDLPGNPIVGHDIRLRDNIIRHNNHRNFAPGGTVQLIPAGTGTFALASRRVEITNNTYEDNNTGDIAILSGLVIEQPEVWELATADLVGDWMDLGLPPGATPGTIMNFRTEDILISGNTHSGSGTDPDMDGMFGPLLRFTYLDTPVDSIIYDSIGESSFNADDASMNSNDNNICAGANTNGTFASIDLARQLISPMSPILRLETAPFAPFDCTALVPAVAEVTIP